MDVEFLRYQFEDRHDGVVTKNKFKIGVRHLQIIYMFACTVAMSAVRGSIGIAVLAINDVNRRNDTYIKVHSWDSRLQGSILSSFFLGYALLVIPAELILKKISGKIVTTCILAVNGMLCLTMPIIVNRGGWIATCNAVFMMGMTQACLSPANENLLAKWIPPNEKFICSTLVYGGTHLGIIIALPIAGILADAKLGWELIFYAVAMLTLSMAIICALLTAGSPDEHQAVGDEEKEYVKEALSFYKKRSVSPPWRSILRTRQFWALTCAHAACNAVFVFFLVDIPAYLTAVNVTIKDSTLYTLLAFLGLWVTYTASAPTFKQLGRFGLVIYFFNQTNFRKLINGFGACGVVVGLTILSNLVSGWNNLAIIVSSATLAAVGLQYSGFLRSVRDMTENFSGTLLMMSSSIASLFGASIPLINSLILADGVNDLKKWRIVFLLLASFCVICNMVYTVFGSAERQQWDQSRITSHTYRYHGVTNPLDTEGVMYCKTTQRRNEET